MSRNYSGKYSLNSSSRNLRSDKPDKTKNENGTVQGNVNPTHNDESIQKKSTPSNDNNFQDDSKQKDQDFQKLQSECAKLKYENEQNIIFKKSITNEIIRVNSLFSEPSKNKKTFSEDPLNMIKDIYNKVSDLKKEHESLNLYYNENEKTRQNIMQGITEINKLFNKSNDPAKSKSGRSSTNRLTPHDDNPINILKQIKNDVYNLQNDNMKNKQLIDDITKEIKRTNSLISDKDKAKAKNRGYYDDDTLSITKAFCSTAIDLKNDYIQLDSDYKEIEKDKQNIIQGITEINKLFNKSNDPVKNKSGRSPTYRPTPHDDDPINILKQIKNDVYNLQDDNMKNKKLIDDITKEMNRTNNFLSELYKSKNKPNYDDSLKTIKDINDKVSDLKDKYIQLDSDYAYIVDSKQKILQGITEINKLFNKSNEYDKYKQGKLQNQQQPISDNNIYSMLRQIKLDVSNLQNENKERKQFIDKTTRHIEEISESCTLPNKNRKDYQSNDSANENLDKIQNEISTLQDNVKKIRSYIADVQKKMNKTQGKDEESKFSSNCMLNLKLYPDICQSLIEINANNNLFNKNIQAAQSAIEHIFSNMKKSQDQDKNDFESYLAELNPKLKMAIPKLQKINDNNMYLNSVISAFKNSIYHTRNDMENCKASNSDIQNEYKTLKTEHQDSIDFLKELNENNFQSNTRIKSLICCINHVYENRLEYVDKSDNKYTNEIEVLESELEESAKQIKHIIKHNTDSNQMINDLKFCIYYIWSNKMTKDHVEESDFNQKMNEIGNLDTKIKLTYKWSPTQSKSQLSEIFKHIADSNKLIDDFEGCIEHIHKNMKEKEEKTNSTHNERLDDINKLEKTWKKNAPSKEYLIQIHKNNAYLNDAKFLMEEHIIDINNKLTEQYTNNLDVKNMKIKLNDLILQILLNVSKVIDNSDSSPYPQTSYINDEISHVSCVQDTIYDILNSLSKELKDIFKNDGQELPPDVEKKDDEIESDQKLQEQYKSNNDSIIKLNKENQRLKKLTDNQKVIIRKQMILAKIENEEQIRQLREVQRKEIHNLIETMP